ncbi:MULTISPECIES: ABC transporter permease subunit [Burkholderiaceae]|jgi:dipeptide transport system permease protein|uniref:Dipeptide transport system permease protein DppC n=4 Tax=Caballeronia sordidicola TaxID=196367 RepID=A0A242N5R9_CABSO|nr:MULTISPECIES: ABC transporter permease subunit [Burkholderiaceae]MDP9155213.1 ABC transporter permease subunit [Pseudomonadota bacterium]AME23309.1 peptide transporter [Burkholderia sp. PAMC 26561]AMM15216.1 peptide transporter [Burkholderia sp. PAMC 28687]OTP74774.1 Dipeptide transport system permease protein DppC [Caballeronia sordidicola]OTP78922.1 Dipeptide transport system permease protein DppC [Caballeronia sordidicola]
MADIQNNPGALAPIPGGRFLAGREFWANFSRNRGAVVAGAIVLILIFVAIFAPLIAPHSPIEQYRDNVKIPPAWLDGGNWRFVLGTDEAGRDILSRLMYGARLSFWIGFVSVVLALIPGVVLGLIAAFFQKWADTPIMRIMDVLLALPSLLLAVAVVAIIGPGLVNTMLAIAIVALPGYVRLTRAAALGELQREYVTASRVAGAGTVRLMFSQVLPNCAAPLIVQATLGFSSAILDAAALGFLGLGVQPPAAEWGAMLASARDYIESAWWIVTMPGLSILISVLVINLLGDGLRDALDPKLKRMA